MKIMQDDFRDCDFLREVLIVFTSAIRQRGGTHHSVRDSVVFVSGWDK